MKQVRGDARLAKGNDQGEMAVLGRQCMPSTLQRQNAENLKQIFPEKEYWGLRPNFHILVSVSELRIYSRDGSACSAGGNM